MTLPDRGITAKAASRRQRCSVNKCTFWRAAVQGEPYESGLTGQLLGRQSSAQVDVAAKAQRNALPNLRGQLADDYRLVRDIARNQCSCAAIPYTEQHRTPLCAATQE